MIALSTVELWTENVRPYIKDTVLVECRTDSVLTEKLTILVDHVDQDIKNGKSILPRFDQLNAVLNSDSYYDNALKRAKESECEKVRELGVRIAMLINVGRKENVGRKAQGAVTTAEQTEPSRKLPNRAADVRDMYKPIEELN